MKVRRAPLAGIGGDVKYLKTEADAGWYWGFNKDLVFSATGSVGYIEGWGGDTLGRYVAIRAALAVARPQAHERSVRAAVPSVDTLKDPETPLDTRKTP